MSRLKISIDKHKRIVSLYKNGISSIKISKEYKVLPLTIRQILKKYNVKMKTNSESHTKYSLNHYYFKNINTNQKAYFLGLLASDGTNTNKGFSITLQNKDKHILKELKNQLEFTGKVRKVFHTCKSFNFNKKSYSNLYITSYQISKDLSKLGVISNKTNYLKFPNIDKKYYSHFIRGYFDGDGSIGKYKNNYNFSIIGNKPLIKKIQNILISKCDLPKTKIYVGYNCKPNIINFIYTGKNQIFKIHSYLYKNSGDCYLVRKENKFKEILNKN